MDLNRRSENSSSSKRPSQSVVQVDAQGRRYLIAYPPADKLETKPDILNPKPGGCHLFRSLFCLKTPPATDPRDF